MTIGKKIVIGSMVILGMLVLVSLIGSLALKTSNKQYAEILNVHERLVDVSNELRFEVRDQTSHFRGLLLYPDRETEFLDKLQKDYEELDAFIDKGKKLALTKEGLALLDEIKNLGLQYQREQKNIIKLVQQGKNSEATQLADIQGKPIADELLRKAEDFRERELKLSSDEQAAITRSTGRLSVIMIFISILAVLAGFAVSIRTVRIIEAQLGESVNQLTAASSEIQATASQIAAGSAETATSVSETTATVEEVRQTALLASEKAKAVSGTAEKTVQAGETGRKMVEETVAGIGRIREQMESIGESVMRLSEQSQTIGGLIASIDDIANQSNLLAVNAAIEAAKAGEHSKGFTVVAQEIKNLAEQSKQATSQVRAILGEIQKATNSVVMVTEQGSKAVTAGVQQSAETGETIRMLANSITEANRAVTQIAISSQQQIAGMAQIATAMENIKVAATQNVAGTKQMEQTTKQLTEMAVRLKSMIEKKA